MKHKIENPQISIILPTYNESNNIIEVLKQIKNSIPKNIISQTIVVDDNSPDGTGKIVEEYIQNFKKITNHTIDVIHRTTKTGLSSAIFNGIQKATGETIIVMDADHSHPPHIIPKMIENLKKSHYDIVIASRYVTGGNIKDWSIVRKIISKTATKVAKLFLNVEPKDPMSGFFAFKKNILKNSKFDLIGYKILLEMLVKTKDVKILEIPYTFTDRKIGQSKLDSKIILDYLKAVWKLYRYGKNMKTTNKKSTSFISKAARFYTIGASGLFVNLISSYLLVTGIPDVWYIHANLVGIMSSISSNFILNKFWTFEDKDFSKKKTLLQFSKFTTFSTFGAIIQLGMVFYLTETQNMPYYLSLVFAVLTAAFGNFMLNKKYTFKEKFFD
ncbi:MAG: glycosyltransferase [Nitrosopumilus sp.]